MSSDLKSHEESFPLAEVRWIMRGDYNGGYRLCFFIDDDVYGYIEESNNKDGWLAYAVGPDNPEGVILGMGLDIESAKEALHKTVKVTFSRLNDEDLAAGFLRGLELAAGA